MNYLHVTLYILMTNSIYMYRYDLDEIKYKAFTCFILVLRMYNEKRMHYIYRARVGCLYVLLVIWIQT